MLDLALNSSTSLNSPIFFGLFFLFVPLSFLFYGLTLSFLFFSYFTPLLFGALLSPYKPVT